MYDTKKNPNQWSSDEDADDVNDMFFASDDNANQSGKGRQGFASMSEEKQREIASKGGRAAHQQGTAHEWTSDEAREAGRKGGQSRASKQDESMDEFEEAA